MAKVTAGRIVLYTVRAVDAVQVNGRREDFKEHGLNNSNWPMGAVAHYGEAIEEGQELPAVVVKVREPTIVGLQVLLPGNDVLWVKEAEEASEEVPVPGTWRWPPREE